MIKRMLFTSLCLLTIGCSPNSKKSGDDLMTASNELKQNKTDTTEIDFVKTSPDKTKILLENEFVRVIEYTLKPGEKDNPHTHPAKTAYVVSGGTLRVFPEGEKPFDSEEVKGTVEWAGKRGKHYVENIGTTTVTIVLTEVKSAR